MVAYPSTVEETEVIRQAIMSPSGEIHAWANDEKSIWLGYTTKDHKKWINEDGNVQKVFNWSTNEPNNDQDQGSVLYFNILKSYL